MKRENLLGCDGRRFRAKIYNKECEGVIAVEGEAVYLCQDIVEGWDCSDKKGYKYSWIHVDRYGYTYSDVTDLELIPEETQATEPMDKIKELENRIQSLEGHVASLKSITKESICNVQAKEKEIKEVIWKPECLEVYWYVSAEGILYESKWINHRFDNYRWLTGNCFKTKEEAERYLHKQILLGELRHYAAECNAKREKSGYYYFMTFRVLLNIWEPMLSTGYCLPESIIFYLQEDIESALEKFKDRLHLLEPKI